MMKSYINLFFFILFFSCQINEYYDFKPKSDGEIIKHNFYWLSYSEEHEQPFWVFYKLTPNHVNGTIKRTNDFREDKKISTGSAQNEDYLKSGYDRGHLCPAADMKLSKLSMSETFYLSNMSPQLPEFNRKTWANLESKVREWVLIEKELYVISGPVFINNIDTIGDNNVIVPGYFYKIIFDITDEQKMIAFLLKHEYSEKPLYSFVTTVDSIEYLTGIDFFYNLTDSIENKLESKSNYNLWNQK